MTRLKVALMISVALNLFAFGAISSFLIMRPSPPPFGGGGGPDPIRGPLLSPRELDQILSPEGAVVRDEILQRNRSSFHAVIDNLMAARRKAIDAAKGDTVNLAAVQDALAEAQKWDAMLTTQAQQVMIELLQRLPTADRQKVLEASSQHLRMGPMGLPPR
ncbi:periplasmic heavy metal sensor [Insolitispirillum peregrinum]|uniref:periplasmic heavy metal sensor n=1 Tax=Insolitispirillum peregrinum TaxID=80876 RepID=UPI00361548EF